jgi:hypothetical protein
VDHGRHANIWGLRLGLKVNIPPLRPVNRADNLAALATEDYHPRHEHLHRPMKLLPAMDPEAAASMHNLHLGRLP